MNAAPVPPDGENPLRVDVRPADDRYFVWVCPTHGIISEDELAEGVDWQNPNPDGDIYTDEFFCQREHGEGEDHRAESYDLAPAFAAGRAADRNTEGVWPDQSAMHGVLLDQIKDAYAEGIADTIDRLRVRAAEMLPEVARFTLDEIEVAAAATPDPPDDDKRVRVTCFDPVTGESETQPLDPDNYILTLGERCKITACHVYANGTVQLTIKRGAA